MRSCIMAALLGGFLSLCQADSVKTKDGRSYQGTVEHNDADIIKLRLAGSGEVQVFNAGDVEEVVFDSPAVEPAQPENPPPQRQFPPEYWEQLGYADGSRNTGLKSGLAAVGGCIGAPVGGYVGLMAGGAADPYGSSTAACCWLGAAAGGAAGCLGGSGLGSLRPTGTCKPRPGLSFPRRVPARVPTRSPLLQQRRDGGRRRRGRALDGRMRGFHNLHARFCLRRRLVVLLMSARGPDWAVVRELLCGVP
jgi:hypothetical protein